MTAEQARLLYEFNAWANRRVLDACAALSAGQFTQEIVSSFPSVRDTLAHIMGGEWLWLERWKGRSHASLPPGSDYPDLNSIRTSWAPVERDLLAFVNALDEAGLERIVAYQNTAGKPYETVQWQMLQHLVNHGSYHRGQITTLLRQLGAQPVATDLIGFYRVREGQPLN